MGNQIAPPREMSDEEMRSVLDLNVTARAVVERIRDARRIVVLCGAGMSVSAGIPDFRTPGTGLYSTLEQYNLPEPEAMFDLEYFSQNPEPFFRLSKELLPADVRPTPAHLFLKLLADKGKLLRCYTQNIDCLERQAGIPADLLVEAHGSFASASCTACHRDHSMDWLKEIIMADGIPRCQDEACGALVKPDIVFFGENLPRRFGLLTRQDLPAADLIIVIGTSLKVAPVSGLVNDVSAFAPRLLLNLEKAGERDWTGHGFRFDDHDNYRDAAMLTTCDRAVAVLARELGWADELAELVAATGSAAALPAADPQGDAELLDRSWRSDEVPRCLPPLNGPGGLEMDLDVPPGGEYGGSLVSDQPVQVHYRFSAGGPGLAEHEGGAEPDYVGFFDDWATDLDASAALGRGFISSTKLRGTVDLRTPRAGSYHLWYVAQGEIIARQGPFRVVDRPSQAPASPEESPDSPAPEDVSEALAGLSVS